MNSPYELAMASLLGLGKTSSAMLGAAIGLYVPFSKRPLACLLAFAAGSLISALAIELAYEGAQALHQRTRSSQSLPKAGLQRQRRNLSRVKTIVSLVKQMVLCHVDGSAREISEQCQQTDLS